MEHPIPVNHLTLAQIEAGLPEVRRSPRTAGRLDLIVRRPAVNSRELLDEAVLDARHGLMGDTWAARRSTRTPDGSPHPDMQLNVINSRFVELIAGPDRQAWALAGDQLYLDLDLSTEVLPSGTRLAIGEEAVIEVTDQPHTGCVKFASRFGRDAHKAVWTDAGKQLRLRGLNARVMVGGTIRPGDAVTPDPVG
jgi:hypothetical protein